MRITLLLLITVFISTIFWPELLHRDPLLICVLLSLALFLIPYLRVFALIPLCMLYFNMYTHITLIGQIFPDNTKSMLLQVINDKQDHNIVVQVNSLISNKNKGYFSATLMQVDGRHLSFAPQLEMRWYKPTVEIQAGQVHRFKGRLKTLNKRLNPGVFDRQKWLYSRHIAYQFSIKKHLATLSSQLSMRGKLYKKMQDLTQGLTYQGVILALSFADKTLLTVGQKELIKEWGIAHLFVISGLHIGLLFSAVFFLMSRFRFFLLGWAHWHFASFIALGLACFYAYLAGLSLPTQRALLLLFLSIVIFSMRRKCSLLDILPLLLCLLLINDPLAVLSMSLWLSYIALSIILLFCWRFPHFLKRPKKVSIWGHVWHYLKLLFLIQISITTLMMPLQVHYFSALSVGGIVMNLFAIPYFSFCLIPLILIALLCSLIFMPIASILVHGIDTLLTYFFMFLKSMPACYIYFSHQQALIILQVFTFFLIAWLITWHGRKYMTYRFIVCSFLIMITSYYVQEKEDEQTWYVDVIDVGQGLSVLVRTQDQSLLYDTGARYASGFSMAQSEILPYLRYIGIASLEYLVISHSDNDHAGGASLIEKAMHPRRIKLGEPLRKQVLANSSFCDVGERWALGKLSVTVLSPFKRLKNSNNNSCVLRISDGQHAVLLSGDINKKQEALIVSQFSSQLASQILIAPHHGSKYSSSKLWISVVKPKWVVFSVSAMNRWGFPVQEVVERYKKQSVIRVSSGTSGFIRFKIDSHGIKLQTIREDLAAYWYHRSFFL